MKSNLFFALSLSGLILSCGNPIKNENPNLGIEAGTEVVSPEMPIPTTENTTTVNGTSDLKEFSVLGSWVGWFRNADEDNTEGEVNTDWVLWEKENKINMTIESVSEADSLARGYSVVAGNERPFEGIYYKKPNGIHHFELSEPGDHKYDGTFIFDIDTVNAIGIWEAYNEIQTPKRKYTLEKKTFTYNPDVMLEEDVWYVNWQNSYEKTESYEMEEGEFEEFVQTYVATASNQIYKVNGSNTVLKPEDIENLSKGDLRIIRNTIYARHGYSFKNKPLRIFFDQQTWYIPMYANIQKEFSKTETDNIQLILKYEKNAEEYYDYFGR